MKKGTTGAFVALMVLAMSIALVGNAVAATLPGQGYGGDAYGTYVNAAKTVVSGPSSLVGTPCAARPPFHASVHALGVNVAGLLTTGAINTSVTVGQNTNAKFESSSANVAAAHVLPGGITATTVQAVSTTTRDSTGYHVSDSGSRLVGLVVPGFSGVPSPNTRVNLTGVGYVILDEQISRVTSTGASLTVNMIHVHITEGLRAGTQIIVAHAYSALRARSAPILTGAAYSSFARVGNVVKSGPNFMIGFCNDTGGVVRTNQGAGTNLPGIFSTGTAVDTVFGQVTPTTGVGESTSTVQNVNLASGLVTATAVKAVAEASYSGGAVTSDGTESTFTNLKVAGIPIVGNVAPNMPPTHIGNITIYLNHQIKAAHGISVRMIEITVSGANPYGLPVNTDIQVADGRVYAYAGE